jgi:hypothetical protein
MLSLPVNALHFHSKANARDQISIPCKKIHKISASAAFHGPYTHGEGERESGKSVYTPALDGQQWRPDVLSHALLSGTRLVAKMLRVWRRESQRYGGKEESVCSITFRPPRSRSGAQREVALTGCLE